ncbi:MAG: L,D-transpeptidase family protein [Ilyomonas sp.]
MPKHFVLFIATCLFAHNVNSQNVKDYDQYLYNSNQVLFVKTASVNDIHGTMWLYERTNSNKPWIKKDSFAVVVGRAGLAKDPQTKIPLTNMPVKKEGDGKSPSGIFLLSRVFSYHHIDSLQMPFVQVDTNFYCVDDASSVYYNTLIVNDTAKQSFNSFEHMKLNNGQYEYGVWVLYNSDPEKAGNGSCIFIQVWNNENTGTSGCTAMSKENILKLIHWLDKKKNPVLLQVVAQ